jgi:hypothetical protein
MEKSRVHIAAVAALVGTILMATPALGASQSGSGATASAATPELVKATPNGSIYIVKGAPQRTGSVSGATINGCWTITWIIFATDIFGIKVWQYNHRTNWCGDGTVITGTPQVSRWASNMAPFWAYSPVGGIQTWWGAGHKSYRSFSQGEMRLCAILCTYAYPWIDQTVKPNGTVTGDGGT